MLTSRWRRPTTSPWHASVSATQLGLQNLNDDILHVLCEWMLCLGDDKLTLIAFTSSSRRLARIGRRYVFRELNAIAPKLPDAEVGYRYTYDHNAEAGFLKFRLHQWAMAPKALAMLQ